MPPPKRASLSESLNFAALKKLPIVFFCENNFYSVQSPLATRQPARDIRAWAAAHGMPAVAVDGVNVLAVRHAEGDAVARARSGDGPTFIEAPVYRFRAHGGAGDDSRTGYRDEAERQSWEAVDPLHLFGEFLTRRIAARCAGGRRRWSGRSPPRLPRPSSSRSPAPTLSRQISIQHVYAD